MARRYIKVGSYNQFIQISFIFAGRHFNYLMKKYGSPIVVLNLMKKTEEKGARDRRREGALSDEFRRQVNQNIRGWIIAHFLLVCVLLVYE